MKIGKRSNNLSQKTNSQKSVPICCVINRADKKSYWTDTNMPDRHTVQFLQWQPVPVYNAASSH